MAMLRRRCCCVHYSSIQRFSHPPGVLRHAAGDPGPGLAATARPRRDPAGRACSTLWLLSFLAFALAAVVFHAQGIHLSGDEPHYVMIAQSLVDDNDFDLKNNLRGKDLLQLPAGRGPLPRLGPRRPLAFVPPARGLLPAAPVLFPVQPAGGSGPGPPLFPPGGRLDQLLFRPGPVPRPAPAGGEQKERRHLHFLPAHLPAALPRRAPVPRAARGHAARSSPISSPAGKRNYFVSGLLLAGIPWLHLKYALPDAGPGPVHPGLDPAREAAGRARAEATGRFRRGAGAEPGPAGAVQPAALRLLRSRAPSRPERSFLAIPLKFKIETLLSFFLDQRDGLLLYAPLFLLVFLVFKKEVRSGIRDFALLAAMFASYVLLPRLHHRARRLFAGGAADPFRHVDHGGLPGRPPPTERGPGCERCSGCWPG